MPTRDYNGSNEWSIEGVLRRYANYCQQFGFAEQRLLSPRVHSEGEMRWIYPIMDAVIQGIKDDDRACTELGIDFISESQSFPFGMTLKSEAARALKRATLSERQAERIRHRVVQMLREGYLPQEYKFYARLLRKTGLGQHKAELSSIVARGPRMERYLAYFQALEEPSGGA